VETADVLRFIQYTEPANPVKTAFKRSHHHRSVRLTPGAEFHFATMPAKSRTEQPENPVRMVYPEGLSFRT
jgi:hypothetical protein